MRVYLVIFLTRAGFVEQIGSGLYNFLPLGKRVLDKIKNIVKEEMDKAGAQEVNLSFITPASLWQESGRYNVFGKELLRFKDRKENEFVLGPTHEEAMLSLVKTKSQAINNFLCIYIKLDLNFVMKQGLDLGF